MQIFTIVLCCICVAYLVIAQVLEAMHHMELIENRWPKAHQVLMSPATRIVLLIVAIGLLAEVFRERQQETVTKHETTPHVAKPQSGSITTGPATTFGPCSAATTGSGNKVEVDCGKTSDNATKRPTK
jgi:hypothetical protein